MLPIVYSRLVCKQEPVYEHLDTLCLCLAILKVIKVLQSRLFIDLVHMEINGNVALSE